MSAEGATLETITVRSGECMCMQIIPMQLALRFQNPLAGCWLRQTQQMEGQTGEEREREEER